MSEKMNREPWLAALLSMMVTGAGQAYGRRALGGVLFFAGSAASFFVCLAAAVRGEIAIAAALLLAPLALKLASAFDAFFSARRANDAQFEERRNGNRDPWCGVFLSYLIPGAGHIYLRKAVPAVLFLAVNFVVLPALSVAIRTNAAAGPALFVAFLYGALTGFASWHAYRSSGGDGAGRRLASTLAAAIAALQLATTASALAIRGYILQAYRLPTASMEDTLHVGDNVLVEKASCSPLLGRLLFMKDIGVRKGDIVIFRAPMEKDKDHAKRCVAVAGDELAIRDGAVFVNGARMDEAYAKGVTTVPAGMPDMISGVVPAGRVVLLGDNRANSLDSRHYGYVDTAAVSGKVCAVYWNGRDFMRLDFSRFGRIRPYGATPRGAAKGERQKQ